jgi:glycosyltransferase involved in cell wall biosynthesis
MKKRILFVNGHMNVGGVEKSLLDILRHLDYGKCDVDLLLLEDLGDYIQEVPPQVHVVFKDLTNTYGPTINSLKRCVTQRDWLGFRMRLIFLLETMCGPKVLRLARVLLLVQAEYDCAIGYRPGICSNLVAYAVKARRKITWWHHGELNMDADRLAAYEKTCQRFAQVVAVSQGCAHMLSEAMPSIANRITVIPNMVDGASIRAKAELFNPYRAQPGLRLVTVGRIFPEKHVENVVYAAERLLRQGLTDFHWHIVGDGTERGKIEAMIKDKHLEDCVSLEGSQPNPYPFVKHATLYVHTSYIESQGLTILEAMALGIPCVVTRSPGPEEFLRDGENGILVEQNVDSLGDAILEVVGSPERYGALRKSTQCPPGYSCETVMRKIEAALNGLGCVNFAG